MVVDAQSLHHRLPATAHHQPASAVAAHSQANRGYVGAVVTGDADHGYGGAVVAGDAAVQCKRYGYQSSCVDRVVVPPSLTALAGAADRYSYERMRRSRSGMGTFDATAQQLVTHKRKRTEYSPVLDAAVLASQAHQQRMEIDRLVLNHTTQIWTGLREQSQNYMKLVVETVEANAAKRLQEKDEEIRKVRSINWVLEERLKFVYDEAQIWRNIAQSSEATVNALRDELDQTLNMHARHGDGDIADNAESCCYGENEVAVCMEEEINMTLKCHGTTSNQSCKGCGKAVAEVLLLPCRHLSTCVSCAATVLVCPACGCAKNSTICVNFS